MRNRRKKLNKRQPPQVNSPFQARKGRGIRLALILTGAILLILALLAAAVLLDWIHIPGLSPDAPADTPTAETVPDTVIHFVAGGDVNVTDRTVAAGQTEGGYDYSKVFLDVMPVLSGADLTALNFEGNLCGEPYGSLYASAPQQLVQALHDAGVDILQSANSKTITGGPLGLVSTINGIRAADLTPLGSFINAEEFERTGGFVIREIQGIRVALMAFTKGMDNHGLSDVSQNCVNLLYTDYFTTYQKIDEAGITAVLRAAAAQKPDVTIALLHWGSEFNNQISASQKKIVALMQAEGVDAIIGTHPHYVQQMTYDASSGQFVAYSLGDFFGDAKTDTDYSVLLDLQITKSGATGETKITGYSYEPIYIAYEESCVRILRIREAMTAFEAGSLGRVTQETYDAMANALAQIEKRIHK